MPFINHTPCVTDEDVAWRIVEDQKMIQKLIGQGYEVRSMISYSSETTGETHCLPIFARDNLYDIVNRYYDFYPREFQDTIEAAAQVRQTLDRPDGMSKARTMMASFKVPLGLYKMLDAWLPGFWEVENGTWRNKKLVKTLMNYISKCKVK